MQRFVEASSPGPVDQFSELPPAGLLARMSMDSKQLNQRLAIKCDSPVARETRWPDGAPRHVMAEVKAAKTF